MKKSIYLSNITFTSTLEDFKKINQEEMRRRQKKNENNFFKETMFEQVCMFLLPALTIICYAYNFMVGEVVHWSVAVVSVIATSIVLVKWISKFIKRMDNNFLESHEKFLLDLNKTESIEDYYRSHYVRNDIREFYFNEVEECSICAKLDALYLEYTFKDSYGRPGIDDVLINNAFVIESEKEYIISIDASKNTVLLIEK